MLSGLLPCSIKQNSCTCYILLESTCLPQRCSYVWLCQSIISHLSPARHCSGLAAGDRSCVQDTVPHYVAILLVLTSMINPQVPELCYCVCVHAQLEECQRTHDMAAGPVTLAAVARERMQQVSFRMRDASLSTSHSTGLGAANNVVVPKVDFPRPKSFKPRTHNRRRSSDLDNFDGPGIAASPAVSLPVPETDLPSPVIEPL